MGIAEYLATVSRFYVQGRLNDKTERILERKAALAGIDLAEANEARTRLIHRYEQYRETIRDLSVDGSLSDDDRIELADIQALLGLSDDECRDLERLSTLQHADSHKDAALPQPHSLEEARALSAPAAPALSFLNELFDETGTGPADTDRPSTPAPSNQVVVLQTPSWTVMAPATVAHDWVASGLHRIVANVGHDFNEEWGKLPDLPQGIAGLEGMVKTALKTGCAAMRDVVTKTGVGIGFTDMAPPLHTTDSALSDLRDLRVAMQDQLDSLNANESAEAERQSANTTMVVSKGTEMVTGLLLKGGNHSAMKEIGAQVVTKLAQSTVSNVTKSVVARRFEADRKKRLAEAGAEASAILTRLLESVVASTLERLNQTGFHCDTVEGLTERHRLAAKQLEMCANGETARLDAALASLQIATFSNSQAAMTLLAHSLLADDWRDHIPSWISFFQTAAPAALDLAEDGTGRALIATQLTEDFKKSMPLAADRIQAFKGLIDASDDAVWKDSDWSTIVVPLATHHLTAQLAAETLPSELIDGLSSITGAIAAKNDDVIKAIPTAMVDQYTRRQVLVLLGKADEPDLPREAKALAQLLLMNTTRIASLLTDTATALLRPIQAGEAAPGITIHLIRLHHLAGIFGPDTGAALDRIITGSAKKSRAWLTAFVPTAAQTQEGIGNSATLSALLLTPEKRAGLLDEAAKHTVEKRVETEAPYDSEWLSAMSEQWGVDARSHWHTALTSCLTNRILAGAVTEDTYGALRDRLRGPTPASDLDRNVYNLVLQTLTEQTPGATSPWAILDTATHLLGIDDVRRSRRFATPILRAVQRTLAGTTVPGELVITDNPVLKGILERLAKRSCHILATAVIAYGKGISDGDDIVVTPIGFATGKGRWHSYHQLGTVEARQGWTQAYIAYTIGSEKLEINNLPGMDAANWLATAFISMKTALSTLIQDGGLPELDDQDAAAFRLLMVDWTSPRPMVIALKEKEKLLLSNNSTALALVS
ncbi:hypothetical protein GCM10022293_00950 [Azospirillum formosense]